MIMARPDVPLRTWDRGLPSVSLGFDPEGLIAAAALLVKAGASRQAVAALEDVLRSVVSSVGSVRR